MLFPPFSFERTTAVRVTGRLDVGARLLAQTGDNLGDTGGAARAAAATSYDLAAEAERSRWRSIW
jgi:hypothetical protein